MADTPLNQNTLDFFKEFEEGTKKIEPVNSGLITNPDEKDYNFWEKTGRLSLSVGQGVVNAVEEMVNTIDQMRKFEMHVKLIQMAEELDQAGTSLLRIPGMYLIKVNRFTMF